MDKPKYIINEEAGVVVCLLENCEYDAVREYYQMGGSFPTDIVFSIDIKQKTTHILNNKYRGVAKCNFEAGDIFDEEFGKKLAYNKAQAKYLESKLKALEFMQSDLAAVIDKISEYRTQKTEKLTTIRGEIEEAK